MKPGAGAADAEPAPAAAGAPAGTAAPETRDAVPDRAQGHWSPVSTTLLTTLFPLHAGSKVRGLKSSVRAGEQSAAPTGQQ